MSDKDRILSHFHDESASHQSRIASDFDSFLGWVQAIGILIKVGEYAHKLWKWLRKNW